MASVDLDEESSSLGVMGLERRVLDVRTQPMPPRFFLRSADARSRCSFSLAAQIRRVSKTTKGGRHPSVSVFVVVGNGNGAAGYALGKGETVGDATLKASLRAVKRMQAFNRCGDRTLPHRIEQKLGATRVQLWPLPAGAFLLGRRAPASPHACSRPGWTRDRRAGSGARTHRVIADICDCIGLDGVGGKVLGSRNVGNVIHATFSGNGPRVRPPRGAGAWSDPVRVYVHGPDILILVRAAVCLPTRTALAAQRTPQEVARERGLKVVDLSPVFEQREHRSRSKHT